MVREASSFKATALPRRVVPSTKCASQDLPSVQQIGIMASLARTASRWGSSSKSANRERNPCTQRAAIASRITAASGRSCAINCNDVAMSIGNRSCAMARFKPTPITMATRSPQPVIGTISARTPPSFRPSAKISLGHFNAMFPMFPSKPPPQSRTAPTIASRISQPAIICSQPLTDKSRIIETGTLTTSDTMNDSPGTLVHVWSRRPRPAV